MKSLVRGGVAATAIAILPICHADAAPKEVLGSTSQAPSGLEEIVVTARKREETAQIAPVALTAVSGATLEKAELKRFDDLTHIVPSLNISQSAAYAGSIEVFMRGIGESDTALTSDSPVAIYIDGVYIGRNLGSLFDLIDIDRVEVLRGPQGTLFGRNTTGGAISLFTKAPSQTFGLKEELGYASDNEFSSKLVLDTGEIGDTGFSAKFAYRHHQMDGYTRNILTTPDNSPGAVNSNQFFLAIRGDITDSLSVDYKFDLNDETDRPPNWQIVTATPATISYFGKSPLFGGAPFTINPSRQATVENEPGLLPARLQVLGHNLTLDYFVNDALKIKSITAYRSVHERASVELGGTGQLRGLVYDPATGSVAPGNVEVYTAPLDIQNAYQISEELQASGVIDRFNYVAGFYYFDEHAGELDPQIFTFVLPPIGINLTPAINYSDGSRSYAGYGQASYTPAILDDKLELTAGIRYTVDQKSMSQFDTSFVRNLSHSFYDLSESFTAKYQWAKDLMAYFRFSKAYKAGGFNPRSAAGAYGPEKARSFELGLKSDWFERRIRINADIYHTDYEGLQISQFLSGTGGAQSVITNAGAATFDGVELEFTVLPARGWEFGGSASYVDPEYQQYLFADPITGRVSNIAELAKFPYASKATASFYVQYKFEPFTFGDLSLHADWSYTGPRYFTSVDSTSPFSHAIQAPAYNQLGAQAILGNVPAPYDGSLEVKLYGKNLLDEHNIIQGIDFGGLGFGIDAFGRGRVVGLNLSAKF